MLQNQLIQKNRRIQMKRAIEHEFGHLAPDEVDILAAEYEKSETRMIEVIQVWTIIYLSPPYDEFT